MPTKIHVIKFGFEVIEPLLMFGLFEMDEVSLHSFNFT